MTPTVLLACEPIVLMFYAWAGPAVTLTTHISMLAALAVVVCMKGSYFAAFSGLGRTRAFLMMIAANLVSTLPGLLLAVVFATPTFLIFALPILYGFAYLIARLAKGELKGVTYRHALFPSRFAFYTLVCALVAIIPTMAIQNSVGPESLILYFSLKALALFLLLLPSILLTILWECLVVMPLVPKGADRNHVFRGVVRANLATFATIFLIGAVIAVPIRMRRADRMMPVEY